MASESHHPRKVPFGAFGSAAYTIALLLLALMVLVLAYRFMTTDYKFSVYDILVVAMLIFFVVLSSGAVGRVSEITITSKGLSARFNKLEQNVNLILEALRRTLTIHEMQ